MGQRGRPLRRAVRGGEVAIDVLHAPLLQTRLHQFQAAGDASEQVVEVVRQPPGQVPHSLHLLALPQHFLAAQLLGYVPPDRVEESASWRVVGNGRPRERNGRAVRRKQADVELVHRLAAHQGLDDARGGPKIVGMYDLRERLRQQLVIRTT